MSIRIRRFEVRSQLQHMYWFSSGRCDEQDDPEARLATKALSLPACQTWHIRRGKEANTSSTLMRKTRVVNERKRLDRHFMSTEGYGRPLPKGRPTAERAGPTQATNMPRTLTRLVNTHPRYVFRGFRHLFQLPPSLPGFTSSGLRLGYPPLVLRYSRF